MVGERLSAQLLSGPVASDPAAVARRLLAVQAQDARGFRLAIRARTHGLTAADVDRALTDDRTVVVSWLCRGTLHLVAVEDYAWMHSLTTPPLAAANARRLADAGVAPDLAGRAVTEIERALQRNGPMTRAQLAEQLASAGVRTNGAMNHILFLATLRGLVVRGPILGRQHAYVLVRDWLGPTGVVPDRARSLAELARRYLRAHGPADDRDLARWSGLSLGAARDGLGAIASELVQRADGLVTLRTAAPAGTLRSALLLGAFDPLLTGWRDRSFVTGEHDDAVINGSVFRPVALLDGHLVGVWSVRGSELEVVPVVPLDAPELARFDDEVADVRRYLDLGGSERA